MCCCRCSSTCGYIHWSTELSTICSNWVGKHAVSNSRQHAVSNGHAISTHLLTPGAPHHYSSSNTVDVNGVVVSAAHQCKLSSPCEHYPRITRERGSLHQHKPSYQARDAQSRAKLLTCVSPDVRHASLTGSPNQLFEPNKPWQCQILYH
jgi:hypothetical protein